MAYFEPSDVEKNRVLGGLGYLVFFLPLIACPKSRFGRFCANQGLLVWIASLAVWIAFGVLEWILGGIPVIGWLVSIVHSLCNIAIAVIALYYAYLAISKGEARELPYIGSYTLIK
jgi:uncharacterized membrane protein